MCGNNLKIGSYFAYLQIIIANTIVSFITKVQLIVHCCNAHWLTKPFDPRQSIAFMFSLHHIWPVNLRKKIFNHCSGKRENGSKYSCNWDMDQVGISHELFLLQNWWIYEWLLSGCCLECFFPCLLFDYS